MVHIIHPTRKLTAALTPVVRGSGLPPGSGDVSDERPQPGEAVAGVNVMLHDVEGEVIRPREAPDGQPKEQRDLRARHLDEDQGRRKHPAEDE